MAEAPGDSSGSECADLICECIAALQPALTEIDSSVNHMNENLTEVIEDFHAEFVTDNDYEIDPLPDISGVLDANRPPASVDRQDTFVDDNVYFTDQGDDVEGDYGKLPPAPEPSAWPGFTPDNAMPPEQQIQVSQEPVLSQEPVISQEMQEESFTQSPQMSQSNEMQQTGGFVQTPEMSQDTINQSPQMSQDTYSDTEIYNRNHFYNQTNTNLGGN